MKILVTGGSGVIGAGVVPELLARGHSVRLLSRHADDDAARWDSVEPFRGDVANAASIFGAATGCDAVLHIAGIAAENPPDLTFASVNVDGTANILAESERGGAARFVFISSLGADTGHSDYQKSKFDAERLVERSSLNWTIIRPGSVYGPGDEVISMLLKMVRRLPAVPLVAAKQEFQPIWYDDLAKILASAIMRDDLAKQTLEAAGEVTSLGDLFARLTEITGRQPLRIPVPMSLAELTTNIASLAVDLPIDENKLTMLDDGNIMRGRSAAEVLGVSMTPLARGLRLLADALPEALPDTGVGALEHKRFYADIGGSRLTAAALMALFRERVTEIMALEFAAEPDVPRTIDLGTTLTAALPARGNIQVRAEVVEPAHVVLATIEGHPLSGIVEFTASDRDDGVRFAIDIYARAANVPDWLAMKTIGTPLQAANWRSVIRRIVEASGGTADDVREERRTLEGDEASAVEERVRQMVLARSREHAHESASEHAP